MERTDISFVLPYSLPSGDDVLGLQGRGEGRCQGNRGAEGRKDGVIQHLWARQLSLRPTIKTLVAHKHCEKAVRFRREKFASSFMLARVCQDAPADI